MNLLHPKSWRVPLACSVAVLACAAITLAQIPRSPANAQGNKVQEVVIKGFSYQPRAITVRAGDIVVWVNQDRVVHTATSGEPGAPDAGEAFDSGPIPPGQSYEHQFTEPGAYAYFCRAHPAQMRGATVTVQP